MDFTPYDDILASVQKRHNEKIASITNNYNVARTLRWLLVPGLPIIYYGGLILLFGIGPAFVILAIIGILINGLGIAFLIEWNRDSRHSSSFRQKIYDQEKLYKQEIGLRFASAYHAGEDAIVNLFVMNPSICSEDTLNFIRANKIKVNPVKDATISLG